MRDIAEEPKKSLDVAKARPRLEQLDSVRGICAILVILYHCRFTNVFESLPIVRNGYLFVDFFFVLSGFVLYYNYQGFADRDKMMRFIGLRFFRLYPLHFFMLLIFLAYETARWSATFFLHLHTVSPAFSTNDGTAFILNLFLLNGVGIEPPTFNDPSWSISAEFWTYIIFGLWLLYGFQKSRRNVAFAFFATSLGAMGLLLYFSATDSVLAQNDHLAPIRCVFEFFLGALLSLAFLEIHKHMAGLNKWSSFIQASAVLTVVMAISILGTHRSEISIPFAFAAVIGSLSAWPHGLVAHLARSRPLLWLGKLSYSIYMVHMVVVFGIEAVIRLVFHARMTNQHIDVNLLGGSAFAILCVAIDLLIASCTYRWIEEPGRLLGRRLFRVDSGHASVPNSTLVRPKIIGA